MTNEQPRPFGKRLKYMILYRLVAPILRSKHPPEYTARGVLFGLLAALTPTVGVQMAVVLVIWGIVKKAKPAWNFNVIIAMAWTWVTNIFTVPPIYYLFLVTGRVMLGQWDDISGYDEFANMLDKTLSADASFLESLWIYTAELFLTWGVPMFLGCIPWAILGAWAGYRWSLTLLNRFHARRRKRIARRRKSAAASQ